MVSLDDFEPVLERSGLSYYLPSITFGYLYYLNTNNRIWFFLMLLMGFIATIMYVEEEIIESIERDLRGEGPNDLSVEQITHESIRDEYAHATPWLYAETILTALWVLSLIFIVGLFVKYLDWGSNLVLAGLGFVNIMYFFGWVVDQIYRRKYRKYYFDKFVKE